MPSSSTEHRFSPIRHVWTKANELELSPRARHLALEYAVLLRRMADGSYQLWRGRESISKFTGLSVKTLTKIRRELLDKCLFIERWPTEHVAANGRSFPASPRVPTLELVLDPAKLALAREAGIENARDARTRKRAERMKSKRRQVLELQRLKIKGELSDEEYLRQIQLLEAGVVTTGGTGELSTP